MDSSDKKVLKSDSTTGSETSLSTSTGSSSNILENPDTHGLKENIK